MTDWAAEHTLNWVDRWHTSGIDFQAAIEGATREALAKAADVAIKTCACGHADECVCGYAADAIRALGAAK